MYTFTIYYSKEFKLFDLTITKNNRFHSHYHLNNKKQIDQIINTLPMSFTPNLK
jgi:hypothetical protein